MLNNNKNNNHYGINNHKNNDGADYDIIDDNGDSVTEIFDFS